MARKKIVPKALGPVRIPKSLRKFGDKALADPKVVGIVSGAVASVAALVAARKAEKRDRGHVSPDGASASGRTVQGIAEVLGKALEDARSARAPSGAAMPKAEGKRGKRKSMAQASAYKDAEQAH